MPKIMPAGNPNRLRAFLARYTLATGARGTLTLIAATTFDAADAALAALGTEVRLLNVEAGAMIRHPDSIAADNIVDGPWPIPAPAHWPRTVPDGEVPVPPPPSATERQLRLMLAAPALRDALARLYRVCRDTELADPNERPSDDEWQHAMRAAHAQLVACGVAP